MITNSIKQKLYSSEGVVLSRKIYGESDRILILLTKHYGKLKILAKGVRKPKSRKRGHIEIFSHIKFSATKLKGIDLMTEAQIINSFTPVRNNLKRITLAYYFMEVISKLIHEDEKNLELFELLVSYLKKLEQDTKLKSLRKEFVRDVLTLLGFWNYGSKINDIDILLEDVAERKMLSFRVGSQMLK